MDAESGTNPNSQDEVCYYETCDSGLEVLPCGRCGIHCDCHDWRPDED